MSAELLADIDRLLTESGDADDVLRGTISTLVAVPNIVWAGIAFVEGDDVTLGPVAGTPDDTRRTRVRVVYRGSTVGELWVDGDADAPLLAAVATRIAPQVLIGWDTDGVDWEP